MNTPVSAGGKWDERSNADARPVAHDADMFDRFFDRSAEAMWIFDPQTGVFVDCNAAAVALLRADSKADLLQRRPEELSPARQPDGDFSVEISRALTRQMAEQGGGRFEWLARRFDGVDLPLQVFVTVVERDGRPLH